MVPGNLLSVLLGVLPPPGFGGGGVAVEGGEGLGGAVDLGCALLMISLLPFPLSSEAILSAVVQFSPEEPTGI